MSGESGDEPTDAELIHDLDGLMAAFGATSLEETAEMIDEHSDGIPEGRFFALDTDAIEGEVMLVIDTLGIGISFPTTVEAIVELAHELEAQVYEHEGQATYRIVPGDPNSQVIIHVPHSSRHIPDGVRGEIDLSESELVRELNAMTDSYTDLIALQVAEAAGKRPWLFINDVSRLVVDPERFPDSREEMNAVGMGAVYTKTSTGALLRINKHSTMCLLDRFYWPYAQAFTDLVDQRLTATGAQTIVDLHSYPLVPNPYELHADGPRPQVCLGTDSFHTPSPLVEAARHAFAVFEIGLDSPFSGCYVPLKHHDSDDRVEAIMLELRRDLYMDDALQLDEVAAAPVVAALTVLLGFIDPFTTCSGMVFGDAE